MRELMTAILDELRQLNQRMDRIERSSQASARACALLDRNVSMGLELMAVRAMPPSESEAQS